jgi:hypothetical protein
MLNETANHAREDVARVSDPKAQALFETAAEVLLGLAKAFADVEQKDERAWKSLAFSPATVPAPDCEFRAMLYGIRFT